MYDRYSLEPSYSNLKTTLFEVKRVKNKIFHFVPGVFAMHFKSKFIRKLSFTDVLETSTHVPARMSNKRHIAT